MLKSCPMSSSNIQTRSGSLSFKCKNQAGVYILNSWQILIPGCFNLVDKTKLEFAETGIFSKEFALGIAQKNKNVFTVLRSVRT